MEAPIVGGVDKESVEEFFQPSILTASTMILSLQRRDNKERMIVDLKRLLLPTAAARRSRRDDVPSDNYLSSVVHLLQRAEER